MAFRFLSHRFAPTMLALAASAATLAAASASAADFYSGKTIDMIVGADVGGGYDIYARAIARHLADHIPGQPTIVVKNMQGAGSTRAADYLSTLAPKNGTALAAVMPGAIIGPLLAGADPMFDPTKVLYIGTANSGTRVCATLQPSQIKTYDDALARTTIIGGTSRDDATRDYAYMHKNLTKVKFDIVAGYKGTNEIGLAMERGEVEGICGWDWSSLKSQHPDWISDHKLNVLVQDGIAPDAELTGMGVPPIWSYVSDGDRKVVEFIVSQQAFLRSYIAPPGTPAQQLAILRAAFDATMSDKDFRSDAAALRLAISPMQGAALQQLVTKLYATPNDVIERARDAIKPE